MKRTPNRQTTTSPNGNLKTFSLSNLCCSLLKHKDNLTNRVLNKPIQIFAVIFFLGTSLQAMAQTTPKSAVKSIAAPEKIKIDGDASDWNNQFSGYNNSTEFYYSVANDSKNVYLIIKVTDPLIEKKILRGGVTISLRWHEKGNTWLKISYPMLNEREASDIGFCLSDDNLKEIKKGESKKSDSLLTLMNSKLRVSVNKIGVSGTPLIQDSLLSIYNDKGIRAGAMFNNKAALTYEIAVPLKYFPGNPSGMFDYNMKSNGIFTHVKVIMLDPTVNPNTAGLTVVGSSITGKTGADVQLLNSDADFSGQIELVKSK